ncbi:sugar phosphate isomerase/epimerase family protein [Chelatococcus sp. GCM10030263]|uniref:sugar phosphate isomerase/epimerase family protein n=1 Tax=Chelatococcus sp. GCM10030263 TaxID=3273387 RepID=UPI00361DDD77
MIRFGMHASLWAPHWSREAAEKIVPDAARHGLSVIEIPLLDPDGVDAAHSAALFAAHGVSPTCSLGLPPDVGAPLQPKKAEEFLTRVLKVSHALGATYLGGVIFSTLGYHSGKPPTEAEYDGIVAALKPVARRAADLGITLGLEPCNRYETHLLNTAAQGVMLLERIGEPNLTIHLDTYHMNIEEKGYANGLKAAQGQCAYVHLSESDRGVPGTGTIDWDDVFRGLKTVSFDGDLVIESFVTMPPSLAAALSVWRPVAKDAEEVLREGVPFLKAKAREHGLSF